MKLDEILERCTEEFKNNNIGLNNDGKFSFARGLLYRYKTDYIPKFSNRIELTIHAYKKKELKNIKNLICEQFDKDLSFINDNPKKYATTASNFVFFNYESNEIEQAKSEIIKIAEESMEYLLMLKNSISKHPETRFSKKNIYIGLLAVIIAAMALIHQIVFN